MSGSEFLLGIFSIAIFFWGVHEIKKLKEAKKIRRKEANKITANNLFKYEHLDRMLEYAANNEYTMMHKDAERGDGSSQLFMGDFFYSNGFYAQAMKWYKRAGKSGCHKSQCRLGEMYCEGKGVETNEEKGRVWLKRSIKNGNTRASGVLDERVALEMSDYLRSVWGN